MAGSCFSGGAGLCPDAPQLHVLYKEMQSGKMVMSPAQGPWVLTFIGLSAASLVGCTKASGTWPCGCQFVPYVDGQNNYLKRLRDPLQSFRKEWLWQHSCCTVWRMRENKKQRGLRATLCRGSSSAQSEWARQWGWGYLSLQPKAVITFIIPLQNVLKIKEIGLLLVPDELKLSLGKICNMHFLPTCPFSHPLPQIKARTSGEASDCP